MKPMTAEWVAKAEGDFALLEQALSAEPAWESFREDLAYPSDFAVTSAIPANPPTPNRHSMLSVAVARFAM